MVDYLTKISALRWFLGKNARSTISVLSVRNSSYRSSPVEGSPELYTNVEISKCPEEWKHVERLLAPKIVPQPVTKPEYPSGWIPPSASAANQPYFVERTKNHMPPVYLHLGYRGARKITQVKRIQGDIWLLENDLKSYLEEKANKKIASQVHEVNGHVNIKGDYVNYVKEWIHNRGF